MISGVKDILAENKRRNEEINKKFDPLTGEGSILERTKIELSDFALPVQWIPKDMLSVPLVRGLKKAGSIERFLIDLTGEYNEEDKPKVVEQFVRIRCEYDFCFWAILYVLIKPKEGGEDIPFRLNRPQRVLIETLERMRIAGKPIRLILLKARQWGGSTATQMYMAWIQLVHIKNWNSLIVGHVKDASAEVLGMFDKMLSNYPIEMMYEIGEEYDKGAEKVVGVTGTQNIKHIPSRNFKIKIGTAERPDSARGGDTALVHCTEVAFWRKTEGKTPEQIVRSACSGASYKPLTLIVYESTANGTGNFFQSEYDSAKRGDSMFDSLFIPWFMIERYSEPIEDIKAFATWLWENRENENTSNEREASGRYLFKLFEIGATLEGIHWYTIERKKFTDNADMAAEFPSDDVEAFKHSGARVFNEYKVEELKPACKPPMEIGAVQGRGDEGKDALTDLKFLKDKKGGLWIWRHPEIFSDGTVSDRYLTVVDIGGRSNKSDWSVIVVFDRYWMMEGGKPSVVAQWYGHIDHDKLAWKAAQIAAYYNNSLLVIESNTLETKDKDRSVDGDQSSFILNQIKDVYPNLYARKQSEEDIIEKAEIKYGFHTNISTKPMIISTLIKVVRESLYTERDIRCIDEYLTYERKQNGAYGAITGKHDDLLMTRAIGLHICFQEMDLPRFIPYNKTKTTKKRVVSEATI